MNNEYGVEATIHRAIDKGGYRIKVSIVNIGVYFNGFRGYPSDKNTNDWVIYPPSQYANGKYIPIIEFDNSMPLWQTIREQCIGAIETYTNNDAADELDISDEAIERGLDEGIERLNHETN